eukprot:3348424-Pyramimonas_sp.AAC.1
MSSKAAGGAHAAGGPPARLPPEAAPDASPAPPPALLLPASASAWARSCATRPSTEVGSTFAPDLRPPRLMSCACT